MSKKHKKDITLVPSFQTAASLLKENSSESSISSITINIQDVAQVKASYYREKAKVKNTEKSTKNWITKFEEFRTCVGYSISLTDLNNASQLQKQIVEFISTIKKKDGNKYKATSVKQSVDALN